MIAPDAMELFDCSVTGKFGFNNGRLTTISLFFGHQSDDESKVLVAYTRFISQAVSEFTKRAGKPHVVVRGDSLIQTWVNSPSLWCELNTNRDPRQPYAYLVLADPATKPRGVPKSTADGTQPKQTWLNKGWLGFKFGMGCADVRRLAELPSGDLKAKRPPWLLEDQDDPGKVLGVLEPDAHAFNIVGEVPEIRFTFLDGKLAEVCLKFQKSEDESRLTARESLRDLLSAKYGTPTHQTFSTREGTGLTNMRWQSSDLDVMFISYRSRGGTASIFYINPKVPFRSKGIKDGASKDIDKI